MQHRLIVCAVALLLCACAQQPHSSVSIAGGNVWPLLTPAQLDAPAQALQAVEVRAGDHAAAFLFFLEADAVRLTLVSTTPDGTELFRLVQSGENIEQRTAPFLPKKMQPRAVLADLQMAFAPLDIVQRNLSATDIVVSERTDNVGRTRTYQQKNKQLVTVHCAAANCWNGKVELQNHAWNYRYVVAPIEIMFR